MIKTFLPFLLLTVSLTACGEESDTSSPDDSEVTEGESPSDPTDTDSHTHTYTPMEYQLGELSDNVLMRLRVCKYVSKRIDINPFTGEATYALKWHCPPGFN